MVQFTDQLSEPQRIFSPRGGGGSAIAQGLRTVSGIIGAGAKARQEKQEARLEENIFQRLDEAQTRAIDDKPFDIAEDEASRPIFQRLGNVQRAAEEFGTSTARIRLTLETRRAIDDLSARGISSAAINKGLNALGLVDPETELFALQESAAVKQFEDQEKQQQDFLDDNEPLPHEVGRDTEETFNAVQQRMITTQAIFASGQRLAEAGFDPTSQNIRPSFLKELPVIRANLHQLLESSVSPAVERILAAAQGETPDLGAMRKAGFEIAQAEFQFRQLEAEIKLKFSPAEQKLFDEQFGDFFEQFKILSGLAEAGEVTAVTIGSNLIKVAKNDAQLNFAEEAPLLFNLFEVIGPTGIAAILPELLQSELNVTSTARRQLKGYFDYLEKKPSRLPVLELGTQLDEVEEEGFFERAGAFVSGLFAGSDTQTRNELNDMAAGATDESFPSAVASARAINDTEINDIRLEDSFFTRVDPTQLSAFEKPHAAILSDKASPSRSDHRQCALNVYSTESFRLNFERSQRLAPTGAKALGAGTFRLLSNTAFDIFEEIRNDNIEIGLDEDGRLTLLGIRGGGNVAGFTPAQRQENFEDIQQAQRRLNQIEKLVPNMLFFSGFTTEVRGFLNETARGINTAGLAAVTDENQQEVLRLILLSDLIDRTGVGIQP